MAAEKKKPDVKRAVGIKEQIKKLRQRGLIIDNADYAEEILTSINYYRLVHYFEVFLADKHHYKTGTTFEAGVRLYDFDRSFRALLLVILEEIEIMLRAVVSNYHALKYGALGYLNPSSFDNKHKHNAFLSKIERLIETNESLVIVSHHKNKYAGFFPLWVITELFSFGMLAFFYRDMTLEDKKNIAAGIFSENNENSIDSRHLDSWLDCLSDLRNRCAHYNRLYANRPSLVPREYREKTDDYSPDGSFFGCIYIMKLLCKRKSAWNSFMNGLSSLFEEYSDVADISVMGFPADWEGILNKNKHTG